MAEHGNGRIVPLGPGLENLRWPWRRAGRRTPPPCVQRHVPNDGPADPTARRGGNRSADFQIAPHSYRLPAGFALLEPQSEPTVQHTAADRMSSEALEFRVPRPAGLNAQMVK